jgi:hypothetical protein
MRPQPDEGQPTIRPVIKHLSWRFCKYLQPAPLLTFNFTFPYASGNFAFNLTFKYIILAILAFCFCFWAWVSWSRSKTPYRAWPPSRYVHSLFQVIKLY